MESQDRPRTDATAPARPERHQVRAAVLVAAREVFLELGYHGASVSAIANRAGFSKGAVYSNFEGKADLFLALLADEALARAGQIAVMAADVEVGSLADVSLEERCDRAALAAARGLLAVATERRPSLVVAEFRSFAATDPAVGRRAAVARDEVVATLGRWFAQGLEERGLRAAVPIDDLATTVLALASGLAIEAVGAEGALVRAQSLATALRCLIEPAEAVS